jgi:integrase
VSAVFNKKIPGENPTDRISDFNELSRDRYLQGDELGRLFKELDSPQTSQDLRDIVLIALTTGSRKMNLLSMRWSELNLDLGSWIVPAEKSKNKKNMHVPLIGEAVNILQRRKTTTSSVFVFPGSGASGHMVDIRKAWGALLRRAGIIDLRFHDLRRTLGSWQALDGASLLMIGKSLGHMSTASTEVYARIKDNNPVRDSMAGGYSKMVDASRKRKIVGIK